MRRIKLDSIFRNFFYLNSDTCKNIKSDRYINNIGHILDRTSIIYKEAGEKHGNRRVLHTADLDRADKRYPTVNYISIHYVMASFHSILTVCKGRKLLRCRLHSKQCGDLTDGNSVRKLHT